MRVEWWINGGMRYDRRRKTRIRGRGTRVRLTEWNRELVPDVMVKHVKRNDQLFLTRMKWVEDRRSPKAAKTPWRESGEYGFLTVCDGNGVWNVWTFKSPVNRTKWWSVKVTMLNWHVWMQNRCTWTEARDVGEEMIPELKRFTSKRAISNCVISRRKI